MLIESLATTYRPWCHLISKARQDQAWLVLRQGKHYGTCATCWRHWHKQYHCFHRAVSLEVEEMLNMILKRYQILWELERKWVDYVYVWMLISCVLVCAKEQSIMGKWCLHWIDGLVESQTTIQASELVISDPKGASNFSDPNWLFSDYTWRYRDRGLDSGHLGNTCQWEILHLLTYLLPWRYFLSMEKFHGGNHRWICFLCSKTWTPTTVRTGDSKIS